MKKLFLSIFTLLSIYIQASASPNQLIVILYKGQVASVVIDTDLLERTVTAQEAVQLVGSGGNRLCLGRINMVIYDNRSTTTHNLDLLCNTYNTENNTFVAIHSNSTSKLTLGIEKNFNLQGERTAYTLIDPTSDTTLLRSSITKISCPETYALWFYLLESPFNVFTPGTYTGKFILFFQS